MKWLERIQIWLASFREKLQKQKTEADIARRQEAHEALIHLENRGKGKHARKAVEWLEKKGMI